MYIVYNLLKFL